MGDDQDAAELFLPDHQKPEHLDLFIQVLRFALPHPARQKSDPACQPAQEPDPSGIEVGEKYRKMGNAGVPVGNG